MDHTSVRPFLTEYQRPLFFRFPKSPTQAFYRVPQQVSKIKVRAIVVLLG